MGISSTLLVILLVWITPAAATTLTDTDLGPAVELQTPDLTITVQKSPFKLTVDAGAVTLVEEAAVSQGSLAYFRGANEYRVTQVAGAYTRIADRVVFDCETSEGVGANATVAIELRDDGAFFVDFIPSTPSTVTEVAESFTAPAGERYYGLTERISTGSGSNGDGPSERVPQAIGSLDRRGELVHMSVAATIAIYAPFYHSSNGYGVFVDGSMQGTYDIAKADPNLVTMRFRLDPTLQRFRYHVLYGPAYATILDRYTALAGRPWLPPRWVYKHMRWRDEHASGATAVLDGVPMNAALVEDITMYETLGFPAPGWYNFDRPWTAGERGGCPNEGFDRFAFDQTRFPNSPQMIAAMATRGIRTIVFNAPWACGDSSDPAVNAHDATLLGYYAPNSPDHIDFTNPTAQAWWQDKVADFVATTGISGFKLDRGDESVPSTAIDIYFDGRNGLEVHNDYPRMYVRTYHDALQSRIADDWVTMTRPGYAGSQAYGLYWGGDITGANSFGAGPGTDKGLRSAIISLQRLAFMGFPNWGTDTGGYYQFKQRDVFGRWLAFSAFCPVMEIGGGLMFGAATEGPHAPWAMPTTPAFDVEMIDIYRYYTWLHHELVPYSYSEGLRAHATGHPIATPLVFEYPNDPAVGDLWDQYLYGPAFLVAPLWQDGARSRSVYLPADAWTSYWNESEHHVGPITLPDVGAPLARVPLYIKLGSIIPLEVANAVTGHGSAISAGRLTIDVYPHQSSSYELRESIGGSVMIASTKAGNYPDAAAITITTTAATRDYLLRVRSNYKPVSVTRDGTPLIECPRWTAFDYPSSECGWFFELGGRTLIKYSTAGAGSTLVLTPPSAVLCGNSVVDNGEECDDGNAAVGDGCDAGCQIELGDHYKCYKSRLPSGTAAPAPIDVNLTDAIETANYRVADPLTSCTAVDKNGSGRLVCHRLRHRNGEPDFVPRGVVVQNAFGEQQLDLRQARSLCLPAESDAMPPATLDHYKCYRVRTSGKINRQIFLVDPYEAKTTRVIKPVSFCAAVDANGSGIPTSHAALTCYRVRDLKGQPKFASRDIVLQTPFGAETLTVKKAETLCVPSVIAP